jgi:hypothetical protein
MKRCFLPACLIATLTFLVVGCLSPPQSSVPSSNPQVKVELLFEVDGCKVYRFYDGGQPRYFTKCANGTSSVGWQQSCGKNCSFYAENVTTYGGKEP